MNRNFIFTVTCALCVAFYIGSGRAQTRESGKRQYEALCVGCHGGDGAGGGHGPGFLDVRQPRATSQEAVRNLILKGFGGMPAFKIPNEQADAIAAYVMLLKQPVSGGAPAGAA